MNLERAKEFFINPANTDNQEFVSVVSDTVLVLSQIYATQGRLDLISQEYRDWLQNSSNNPSNLREAIGLVLLNETAARRFDHKFLGQIHPQGNKAGIIGSFVGTYLNTNSVVKEVSPVENIMEQEVLAWLADIFGYDKSESSGNIVSGGTTANITALWVARERFFARARREGRNLRGKNLYVLSTELAHYSITKACDMLSLQLIEVPSKNFKTDPEEIRRTIGELKKAHGNIVAMIGLAGETETGMVDDLRSLGDIAHKNDVYFHVDAAYGGGFVLSKQKQLFDGISDADSITIDPHKMFYCPYPAGAIIFKNKADHILIDKAMRSKARYLLADELKQEVVNADHTKNFGVTRVEGSMGTSGIIASWITMKLFGQEGIKAILDHTIDLTCYMHEKTKRSAFLNPIHNPETNTLLVGLRPNLGLGISQNNNVIETIRQRIEQTTGHYVSTNGEIDDGKNVLRFVAMHPYTTEQDIDQLIQSLEAEIAHLLDK